jgi:hypothetical protein
MDDGGSAVPTGDAEFIFLSDPKRLQGSRPARLVAYHWVSFNAGTLARRGSTFSLVLSTALVVTFPALSAVI